MKELLKEILVELKEIKKMLHVIGDNTKRETEDVLKSVDDNFTF